MLFPTKGQQPQMRPYRWPCAALIAVLLLLPAPAAADREAVHTRARGVFASAMHGVGDAMVAATRIAEARGELVRCPVPGSTFVDSWGAPRSGHTHQGTDMMAPDGTPIVAPQPGTYRHHGAESFYLDVTGGTWFGTHLQEHVAADGAEVQAGEVVALVGHTGNASADAPHLHAEWHPAGGAAAPSYAILARACLAPSPVSTAVVGDPPAESSRNVSRRQRYYHAPRPTFPFGVLEVHRYHNSFLPRSERIDRPTAVLLTAYLNAVVVNYLRRVSIPYEANWNRVAQCESGGNWSINTGNGYYGGLQFSLGTWGAYGGRGYPHQQSKREQVIVAERVRTQSGLHHWPVCGRRWYG